MAFDINKFLTEDLGFDAEEAKTLAGKIKPEAVARVEQSVGLLSANKSANAELQKLQTEVKAANDKLNAEMVEWAQLTDREKAESQQLRRDIEAARVRATQLESRLIEVAKEAGRDPKPLLEGTAVIPEKKEEVAPAIDPNRFVSVEQYGQTLSFALDLPGQLDHIQRQHFELTGKYIDARELVAELKANAQKKGGVTDPVALWEQKYGIPALRDAKAARELEERDKASEQRGYERGRTEATQLPTTTTPGRHAPIFGQRQGDGNVAPRTSVLARPQPGTRLQSAVTALATHKYARKAG